MGPFRQTALMLGLALPFLSHVTDAVADGCPTPDIARAAQQVRDARQAMRALPVPEDLATEVPPAAQRAIAAMKARLGDLVDAYMRCITTEPDVKRLRGELLELARGIDADSTDEDRYGGRIDFDVRLTAGGSRLASIVASFSIQCGTDAALFVFALGSEGWREVLRWHSRDYPAVAGAFWSFDYAISPRDQAGSWYVVAKSVAPWCSSSWSEIRYSVLRPNATGIEPTELFHASHSMWWGGDDFGALAVDADGFTLRYHGEGSRPNELTRQYVRRFRVSGDRVTAMGR